MQKNRPRGKKASVGEVDDGGQLLYSKERKIIHNVLSNRKKPLSYLAIQSRCRKLGAEDSKRIILALYNLTQEGKVESIITGTVVRFRLK